MLLYTPSRLTLLLCAQTLIHELTSARHCAAGCSAVALQHLQGVELALEVLLLGRRLLAGALPRGEVVAGRIRDALQLPLLG